MEPDLAEALVKDVRLDEAKANQNFATFCTTQMEPQADQLMLESLNTNAIDKSEYPKTAAIENYCASMLGHLWGIPEDKKFGKDFIGASTVGSSEGCMLGEFYCPFVDDKFTPWDFRLKNVVSINTSGHKYGMVHLDIDCDI